MFIKISPKICLNKKINDEHQPGLALIFLPMQIVEPDVPNPT